jgi:selenocysteine lyase/cysteine desulfurase
LNAGVKWILENGMESVHKKEMMLFDKLLKGIHNIENIITYCAQSIENHNPIISFNIKGFDSLDVGTMLDVDYNIACRTGLQCAPRVHMGIGTDKIHGTVRLSIGPFNTEEHIIKTIEALKEIGEIRK